MLDRSPDKSIAFLKGPQPDTKARILANSEGVSQVLIPDITFASDPGFAENDRLARATAGVAM